MNSKAALKNKLIWGAAFHFREGDNNVNKVARQHEGKPYVFRPKVAAGNYPDLTWVVTFEDGYTFAAAPDEVFNGCYEG